MDRKPIGPAAHGAIDSAFAALNTPAPLRLGLTGPAKAIRDGFAASQGLLHALADPPLGLMKVVPPRVHGELETPDIPSLLVLPWVTGALRRRNARLDLLSFFALAGADCASVALRWGMTGEQAAGVAGAGIQPGGPTRSRPSPSRIAGMPRDRTAWHGPCPDLHVSLMSSPPPARRPGPPSRAGVRRGRGRTPRRPGSGRGLGCHPRRHAPSPAGRGVHAGRTRSPGRPLPPVESPVRRGKLGMAWPISRPGGGAQPRSPVGRIGPSGQVHDRVPVGREAGGDDPVPRPSDRHLRPRQARPGPPSQNGSGRPFRRRPGHAGRRGPPLPRPGRPRDRPAQAR